MRSSWLVLACGGICLALLSWGQAQRFVTAVAPAEFALQPAEEPATLLAPAGAVTALQAGPRPEKKTKPPKKVPAGQTGARAANLGKLPKIDICHHTEDAERPTVSINVNEHAWKAHERHGDTRGPC